MTLHKIPIAASNKTLMWQPPPPPVPHLNKNRQPVLQRSEKKKTLVVGRYRIVTDVER